MRGNRDTSNYVAVSRRTFLSAVSALAMGFAVPLRIFSQNPNSKGQVPETQIAADPLRPRFHLLPARNWMNDPNGPIFFDGKYHMFFQYNPLAAVWGDMSWYHSVSPDMLHWTHLPLAMTPTPGSPDSFGCFSGSAIQVGTRVYQVYTGTRLASNELATIRDGTNNIQESQCLAYSDDPSLVHWSKLPQPIVPMPPEGMKITGFRDPSAWKQGDWYYMTVASGEAEIGGCVLLYRTKKLEDAKSWEYMHKLIGGEWNGKKTANPCDDGEMWECPDFFALDKGHVLIYSTLGKVLWQSGQLDTATMKFTPEKSGELDLGSYYAPKTQRDAHGRRILWGWIQDQRSSTEMKAAGWSGMMSLPRVLSLDADGTLRIKALPEIISLRAKPLPRQRSHDGLSTCLTQASGEMICTGTRVNSFDCEMATSEAQLIKATYSADEHSFVLDGKKFQLQPNDTPSLHAYFDGSVLEVIVSQRVGYTKRFYYKGASPDISIKVTGTGVKVNGWDIAAISANRLTTPPRSS